MRAPLLRYFYIDAVAEYITRDDQGSLITRKFDIWIGKPHETYIKIPPEIIDAMMMSYHEWRNRIYARSDTIIQVR